VLTVEQVVKVPAGMNSQDLARPVLQITSFLTKKILYEIYSFGEQVVVMDLSKIRT
jgi:ATPase